MNKTPWKHVADPEEPNPEVSRIYIMNGEPMFGMGSTPNQHDMITENLNISYLRGLKDGK